MKQPTSRNPVVNNALMSAAANATARNGSNKLEERWRECTAEILKNKDGVKDYFRITLYTDGLTSPYGETLEKCLAKANETLSSLRQKESDFKAAIAWLKANGK